jgi:hypothetical protein
MVNRYNSLSTREKWSFEGLEKAMDVVENGTTSMRKASGH